MTTTKPTLSFWQIWNMCFGFMGIQFGFALQNANVSRIFQTLGADMESLPLLWIAAPLTGLIVQPIVGYYSDKNWTRLGRRRPFLLYGAIAATLALFVMPNSPSLWIAAGMLWIMDASINVTMEPFRALVGDSLNKQQRPTGYAMQSFFIGVGAVVASLLPWVFSNWFGISNQAPEGTIPLSVKYAFYCGGVVLLLCVAWTVLRTREYSPEQLEAFHTEEDDSDDTRYKPVAFIPKAIAFLIAGGAILLSVQLFSLAKELVLFGSGLAVFGVLLLVSHVLQAKGNTQNGFSQVMHDLFHMPNTMKQLAWVQFFSWFSLFAMWIYTTAAVTSFHFNSQDTSSLAFNQGADWVGVLFAVYNAMAAIGAWFIAKLASTIGAKKAHAINLTLGALGFISFIFITDHQLLIISMIGVGMAWGSILSLPYALLSSAVPVKKMGLYMGIFNFFIVIPQLVAATLLGLVLKTFFNEQAIYALVIAGCSWLIAAVCVLRVKQ